MDLVTHLYILLIANSPNSRKVPEHAPIHMDPHTEIIDFRQAPRTYKV